LAKTAEHYVANKEQLHGRLRAFSVLSRERFMPLSRVPCSGGAGYGAEAQGMRGTGMGCFFDNSVHTLHGFSDSAYQDMYHFAVGKLVVNPRLATCHHTTI
jgi:hypothetical protein